MQYLTQADDFGSAIFTAIQNRLHNGSSAPLFTSDGIAAQLTDDGMSVQTLTILGDAQHPVSADINQLAVLFDQGSFADSLGAFIKKGPISIPGDVTVTQLAFRFLVSRSPDAPPVYTMDRIIFGIGLGDAKFQSDAPKLGGALTALQIDFDPRPGSGGGLNLTLFGDLIFGADEDAPTLDLSLDLPEIEVTARLNPGGAPPNTKAIALADLGSIFDFEWNDSQITAARAGSGDSQPALYLSEVFFALSPLSGNLFAEIALASCSLQTADGRQYLGETPYPLLGFGDIELELDSLRFAITRDANGTTDAYWTVALSATLQIDNTQTGSALALDVGFVYSQDAASSQWKFSGGLNISATMTALVQRHPDRQFVTVHDVTETFGLDVPGGFITEALDKIEILQLAGSATLEYPKNQADSETTHSATQRTPSVPNAGSGSWDDFQIQAAFEVEWDLDSYSDSLITTITAKNQDDAWSGTIAMILDIDGVVFTGTLNFGKHPVLDLSAAIPLHDQNGSTLKLDGEYSQSDRVVDLTISISSSDGKELDGSSISFAVLLRSVLGAIEGNPYVTLPEPWQSILDEIHLDKLTAKLDFKNGVFSLNIEGLNIDLFFFTLTGISLEYAKGQNGQSGSFRMLPDFHIDKGALPDWLNTNWDPTQPDTAPAAPGNSHHAFRIQLAAIGQHIDVYDSSHTIEGVMQAMSALIQDPTLDRSDPAAGWAVGAHMIFQDQADLKLVFNDANFAADGSPAGSLYGIELNVGPSPTGPDARPNKYLAALAGLSAEILYTQVSQSLGLYRADLTLPAKARDIDYGPFQVHLPSIAVEIYTDGEFSIDVGFPYNGDFSKSVSISAPPYTGSGGVFFARLSQFTSSDVPKIDQTRADFGTITEFGFGLQLGYYEGFSSGPLSADVRAVIEGVLQGVFAHFTALDGGGDNSGEYYNVSALVGISGALDGSIDAVIISARVHVNVNVSVAVQAEAYADIVIKAHADIDVDITLRVDLGLFDVTVHASFSGSIDMTATLTAPDTNAPWNPYLVQRDPALPPIAEAGDGYATQYAPHQNRLPWLETLTVPIFRPLPINPLGLELYATPVLTSGKNEANIPCDTNIAGSTTGWLYCVQLLAPCPVLSPATTRLHDSEANFIDLVKLVTVWFLFAFRLEDPFVRPGDDFYASFQVNAAYLQAVQERLQNWSRIQEDLLFDLNAVHALFAENIQPVLAPANNDNEQSQNTSFAFFPWFPGLTLTSTLNAGEEQNTAGPTRSLRENTLADASRQTLYDYLVLVARTTIKEMIAQFGTDRPKKMSITEIFGLLQQADSKGNYPINSVTGQLSRFLLHATRVTTDSGEVPLSQATGQIVPIELPPADQLGSATLGLTIYAPDPIWKFHGKQIIPVTLDETNGVRQPKDIAATKTSASTTLLPDLSDSYQYCQSASTAFALQKGLSTSDGETLRLFSRDLQNALKRDTFTDWIVEVEGQQTDQPYQWSVAIEFGIQQVLDETGQAIQFVYRIDNMSRENQQRLLRLYQDQRDTQSSSFFSIAGLNLAYADSEEEQATPVGVVRSAARRLVRANFADPETTVSILQTNLSTDEVPDTSGLHATAGQAALFDLGRLLSSALTNTGGAFLYYQSAQSTGLPDRIFDESGAGRVSLIVELVPTNAPDARADSWQFVNALYFPAGSKIANDAGTVVSSTSWDAAHPRSNLPPGFAGLSMQIPTQELSGYNSTMHDLFSMLTIRVRSINGEIEFPIARDDASIVGPLKYAPCDGPQPSGTPPNYFRWTGDLLNVVYGNDAIHWSWSSKEAGGAAGPLEFLHLLELLEEKSNPYQFNAAEVNFECNYVDVFGDLALRDSFQATAHIGFSDRLLNLNEWPGLKTSYTVGGTPEAAQLTVHQDWDLKRPYDAAGKRRLLRSLERLCLVYHQLSDVDLSLRLSFLTSPLDATAIVGDRTPVEILRENIRRIVFAYQGPVQRRPKLTPLVFSLPDTNSSEYDRATWLTLSAELRLDREGQAAPAVAENVMQSTIAIAPRHAAQASIASYRDFAADFEAALGGDNSGPGYKILLAGEISGESTPVYLFRYEAIKPKIYGESMESHAQRTDPGDVQNLADTPPPLGYAPRALSGTLINRSISVDTVQSFNQALPADYQLPATIQAVSNFDPESALDQMLAAMDAFLQPAPLVGACANGGGDTNIAALLVSKQTLAKALSQLIVPICGDAGNSETATTFLNSEIEKALSGYAKYDAIAVLTTRAGQGANISGQVRLYGNLTRSPAMRAQPPGAEDRAAFTPFSIPVADGEPIRVALGARTRDSANVDRISMPDHYLVSSVQLIPASNNQVQIDLYDGIQRTYDVGVWASFVLPPQAIEVQNAQQIALPLRAFPASPHLRDQRFLASYAAPQNAKELQTVSLALGYSFQPTIHDQLTATATFNTKPESILRSTDAATDLIDSLVLWQAAAPKIFQGLANNANYATAFQALQGAFQFVSDNARLDNPPSSAPPTLQATARIQEGPDGTQGNQYEAKIPAPECTPADFVSRVEFQIEGLIAQQQSANPYSFLFTQADGTPATASNASANPLRHLVIGEFFASDMLNGSWTLQAIRNYALLENIATPLNPLLNYSSPAIQFHTPTTPFIEFAEPIQLDEWYPSTDIGEVIQSFLQDLSALSVDLSTNNVIQIQVAASLRYATASRNDGPDSPLALQAPLLFAMPQTLDPTRGAELVTNLHAAIEAASLQTPAATGTIALDISTLGAMAANEVPLHVIRASRVEFSAQRLLSTGAPLL